MWLAVCARRWNWSGPAAKFCALPFPIREAVALIPAIKEKVSIPLVADIHFDYRLALEAAAAGIDKIRINPGNIGEESRVKAVADTCRQKRIPIRVGSELRFSGKAHPGKVWRSHAGGVV